MQSHLQGEGQIIQLFQHDFTTIVIGRMKDITVHVLVQLLQELSIYIYIYIYISMTPEGKSIQSKGLVNNYFIAHCFHGYNSALILL